MLDQWNQERRSDYLDHKRRLEAAVETERIRVEHEIQEALEKDREAEKLFPADKDQEAADRQLRESSGEAERAPTFRELELCKRGEQDKTKPVSMARERLLTQVMKHPMLLVKAQGSLAKLRCHFENGVDRESKAIPKRTEQRTNIGGLTQVRDIVELAFSNGKQRRAIYQL